MKKVKPIPCVAVAADVQLCFRRNDHAVDGMKKQRQEDTKYLNEEKIRKIVKVLHGLFKRSFAIYRFRIREHMGEEKHAQRNDARDLMQLTKQKCVAVTDSHSVCLYLQLFGMNHQILIPKQEFGNYTSADLILRAVSYKIK